MVEFIEKVEEETDPFEQYFEEKIVPLVEAENKVKDRYRSKFWGYLFTILFLMSANLLIVLFRTLMQHVPLSWGQLILVNAVAFMFVLIPIYKYNNLPKNDIFDVFLKFYGDWQHLQNSEVKLVHSPIVPKHDGVKASHNVVSETGSNKIEMRDTFYTEKNKTVSKGVMLYITFVENFGGSLLMFDKNGFYRKNKFQEHECYNGKTDIPAAKYFNIFTSDDSIGEKMIHSLFLEHLLDLKDVFKARNLYVQAQGNNMRVYLEGSELYIDNYKLWSKKVDKNRFRQLHHEFEGVHLFVQTVQSLMEEK